MNGPESDSERLGTPEYPEDATTREEGSQAPSRPILADTCWVPLDDEGHGSLSCGKDIDVPVRRMCYTHHQKWKSAGMPKTFRGRHVPSAERPCIICGKVGKPFARGMCSVDYKSWIRDLKPDVLKGVEVPAAQNPGCVPGRADRTKQARREVRRKDPVLTADQLASGAVAEHKVPVDEVWAAIEHAGIEPYSENQDGDAVFLVRETRLAYEKWLAESGGTGITEEPDPERVA